LQRRAVILAHADCHAITSVLRDELKNSGFVVEEYALKHGVLDDFKLLLKLSGKLHGENLVVCYPITRSLLLKLFSVLLSKPRKLALIIPPSSKHKRNALNILLLYLLRAVLSFTGFGKRLLIVFTTPYERVFGEELASKYDYVYYPVYECEKPGIENTILGRHNLTVFHVSSSEGLSEVVEAISILEESGLKPFLVVNMQDYTTASCIHDYRVICTQSDNLYGVASASALVVVEGSDISAVNAVLNAMARGKPVIASRLNGLALYFKNTGLVFLYDEWSAEKLAELMIEVLNSIEDVKKKALKNINTCLKRDLGRAVLVEFFEE